MCFKQNGGSVVTTSKEALETLDAGKHTVVNPDWIALVKLKYIIRRLKITKRR